jgi:pimeloyl-ACP methyl ester carboxylesterase
MTVKRDYVDSRWGQTHIRIGQGPADRPPLLMLHPTPKSGWIYEPLFAPLMQGRTVIAPDTPGYGASDAPPEPAAIEDFAAEMLALMERLAADGRVPAGPFDVMGYHTGSVTSVALAHLAPAAIRRLVLVSLAAYPADVRAAKRAGLVTWSGPREDGSHLAAMWTLMQSLFDRRIDTGWKHASLTENLRSGGRAHWGYDAVYRYDLQAALDSLAHPTLILNPEDDLWKPTRENAPRVVHAEYVELPDLKHGLFELETDKIAGLIAQFLNRDATL